jgi:hypothetical protein
MSVPFVAIPSSWAEGLRPPGDHEPRRPPLVLYTYTFLFASTTHTVVPALLLAAPRGAVSPLVRLVNPTEAPAVVYL